MLSQTERSYPKQNFRVNCEVLIFRKFGLSPDVGSKVRTTTSKRTLLYENHGVEAGFALERNGDCCKL